MDRNHRAHRNSGIAALALGALLTLPALSPGAESSNKGATEPAGQPTFAKHIAPILQARCQECHHQGSLAPMPLVTYQETRPWAKAIKERVIQRQMPPWHIDKTVGVTLIAETDSAVTATFTYHSCCTPLLIHWARAGPAGVKRQDSTGVIGGAKCATKAASESGITPERVTSTDAEND